MRLLDEAKFINLCAANSVVILENRFSLSLCHCCGRYYNDVSRRGRLHGKPRFRVTLFDKFSVVAVNHGGGVSRLFNHAPGVSDLRKATYFGF
jgi:hypothetical protein